MNDIIKNNLNESNQDDLAVEVKETVPAEELSSVIEALIFVHGDPLTIPRMMEVTGQEEAQILIALDSLMMRYKEADGGIELVKVGDKYQFRTRAKVADYLRELKSDRPRKLSGQALETLAIVAYRQPIVKSDIEKLRGVDATPTLKTLLERDLIRIVGHKDAVGQPALYGTTEAFLEIFGIRSLGELPTLRDLREIEEDPGEVETSNTSHSAIEGESNQPTVSPQ